MGILNWFNAKADTNAETAQNDIIKLAKELEENLPCSTDMATNVCNRLRNKPRHKWTESDQRLWDRNGCR